LSYLNSAINLIEKGDSFDVYWLKNNSKSVLLLDSFHFTAMKKNDVTDFYDPICNAVKKYIVK